MWSLLPPLHFVTVFLLLQVPAGKGLLRAVCSHNCSDPDFGALPALSDPPLPTEGLAGRLVEARPKNACHPIKGPPNSSFSSSAFIALIHSSNCSATKVLHAQRAGYQEAAVHNVNPQSLERMASKADAEQKIHIPSMFTADGASSTLKQHHCSGKRAPEHLHVSSNGASQAMRSTAPACKCHIRFPGPCSQTATFHIFWITCIPVSAMIASLLIEKYLSKCKRQREASNQPSRERGNETTGFSLLGSKYQECAICLEKYLEYDSLKILSCAHAFHSRCIDLWHITQTRNKTCPLCMQKVRLVVRFQIPRLWKEEARGHVKNPTFWPAQAKFFFDQ
uniref:E3 ubiquitin-protein ligase RNF167-like n=1 Tax=Euleptes europaea TaxID=460621 RepID=UPI0025401701|nr:E3 ubiquitin-protein ligase RNF167-like [Euleptes europaea]